MGLDHDASMCSRSAAAPVRPLLVRATQPQRRRSPEREAVRKELDALLRVHEPSRTAIDVDRLLEAFAGMERELLACYRQFYAPSDAFSTSNNSSSNNNNSVRVQVSSGSRPTLQLPRGAVPTFLRAKRQAVAAASSKADDVRCASVPTPVAACRRVSVSSPTKQRPGSGVRRASPVGTNAIDLSAAVSAEGLRPARRPTRQ